MPAVYRRYKNPLQLDLRLSIRGQDECLDLTGVYLISFAVTPKPRLVKKEDAAVMVRRTENKANGIHLSSQINCHTAAMNENEYNNHTYPMGRYMAVADNQNADKKIIVSSNGPYKVLEHSTGEQDPG
jgi:hypothetical protein